MNREEFLKELEYLLQDIPDEDRDEALSYYRDYLAEAGEENEARAIEEFGSPERVAALIRAELSGNLKDGGSFTEHGFEDERYRDPNFQVAKRLDLPDEVEGGMEGHGSAYEEEPFRETYTRSRQTGAGGEGRRKRPWEGLSRRQIVLWVLLLLALSPFLLGAAGLSFGAVLGGLSLLLGAVLAVICLTGAMFIGGVALAAVGIVLLSSSPVNSMLLFGIAAIVGGIGILGIVIVYVILAVICPVLWKGLKSLFYTIRDGRKESREA